MSDGLRFIRFSVASPAEENRVTMSYPSSQLCWDISALHPTLLAGEVLLQMLILQGGGYLQGLPTGQPNTRLETTMKLPA